MSQLYPIKDERTVYCRAAMKTKRRRMEIP